MKDFYDYLNEVETVLDPISKQTWLNKHKWAFDAIANEISSDHVVDVGCGCGLLGTYLVWHGKVRTADLYDARDPQITYAEKLVEHLQLQGRVKVHRKFLQPGEVQNTTVVATRFGSLYEFEKFIYKNKLITLSRTKEVEPLFTRTETLPWNKEIVHGPTMDLELLTTSYDRVMDIIDGGRWVEDLNPRLIRLMDDAGITFEERHEIGDDYIVRCYK